MNTQINVNGWYAVLYAGDVPAGTSDEWQLWHGSFLVSAEASSDTRVVRYMELANGGQYARLGRLPEPTTA